MKWDHVNESFLGWTNGVCGNKQVDIQVLKK